MNNCHCVEYSPCKAFGLIISAILGVIAGVLFFNGLIVLTPFISGFILVSAIAFLVLLVIASLTLCCCMCEDIKECFCSNLGFILTGIAGTLITVIFSILFGLSGTLGTIIIALVIFFYSLSIAGIICFLVCVCGENNLNNNANNNTNCCCCCYCCDCNNDSANTNCNCKSC